LKEKFTNGTYNRQSQLALGDHAARQLANATKTVPQLSTITPRWLTHLLQWLPVEAGIYRVNRVNNTDDIQVACTQRDEATLHRLLWIMIRKHVNIS
jgi:hypothetical protein